MDLEQALDYQKNYERKVRGAATYIARFLEDELYSRIIGEEIEEGCSISNRMIQPEWGIVLGSGMGGVANAIDSRVELPYDEIPNFPVPTTAGHEGKLIIGYLQDVPVIALKGRTHYYEVADQPMNTGILQCVFAVNVLAELGISNYLATNATGALNLNYKKGDIMIIKSHDTDIPDPLLGRMMDFRKADGKKLERFNVMCNAYDAQYRKMLKGAAALLREDEHVHCGNHFAVTGPSYETEARTLALRKSGFDAVGMSSVPEVTYARARGMRCLGFSLVTNVIPESGENNTNHKEVTEASNEEETVKRITGIVQGFFSRYFEDIFYDRGI